MSDFAILVLAGGVLFVVFWLGVIWIAYRASRCEPDPHEEVHGDVVKPPPQFQKGN